MRFPRTSGILLHPTSLPGPYGIGDLGEHAYRFVDFLARSHQHLWQLLPLGPTGFGDSPYQSLSAFAGNSLLISPQKLLEDGFLNAEDLEPLPKFSNERVDFGKVIDHKRALLKRAYETFKRTTDTSLRTDFLSFCQRSEGWLKDYALFRVLKDEFNGASWNVWPGELMRREEHAVRAAEQRLSDEIEAEKFNQYLFFKQWQQLRDYCHEHEVSIIGDVPIFVAYDSADVWMHPEFFKLDQSLHPTFVAGVPPDYFSATGQLWGNPLYDWETLRQDGYEWWIQRMESMLCVVDIIRIDHFRGFAACWEIPAGEKTAQNGRWVETPGRDLFTVLRNTLGDLPIIVEDLGVITPDVEALRDDFEFPGMRVLQMAFSGDSSNIDLPHNHVRNAVVYTGTHDNDTIIGWFASKAGAGSTRDAAQIKRERAFCLKYLRGRADDEINWLFIETAWSSVADIAVVPLQDVLGLGSKARMNLPASQSGNWTWRYDPADLGRQVGKRLKDVTILYGRDNAFECRMHNPAVSLAPVKVSQL